MFNQEEAMKELESKMKTSNSPNEEMIGEVLNSIFPINSENGEYALHYIGSRIDISN